MLRIDIKDERNLARYKQGDEIADFLICKQCGVLVGVSYQEGERIYATINRRAIDNAAQFGEESAVSPKLLSEAQKVERWKENWFRDVIVDVNQHAAI